MNNQITQKVRDFVSANQSSLSIDELERRLILNTAKLISDMKEIESVNFKTRAILNTVEMLRTLTSISSSYATLNTTENIIFSDAVSKYYTSQSALSLLQTISDNFNGVHELNLDDNQVKKNVALIFAKNSLRLVLSQDLQNEDVREAFDSVFMILFVFDFDFSTI